MAHVSQEMKKQLAPKIKEICKRYRIRATLSVHNHSSLELNVKSGDIDFINNYIDASNHKGYGHKIDTEQAEYLRRTQRINVNTYRFHEHFAGQALKFLQEVIPALKGPDYFDESDSQTDYFHCSHYIGVNIGGFEKPYILVK